MLSLALFTLLGVFYKVWAWIREKCSGRKSEQKAGSPHSGGDIALGCL